MKVYLIETFEYRRLRIEAATKRHPQFSQMKKGISLFVILLLSLIPERMETINFSNSERIGIAVA